MKTVKTSRVGSKILHRGAKIDWGVRKFFLLDVPIFTGPTTGIILWHQLVIFPIFLENCMRMGVTFAFMPKLTRFFHFPHWDFGILHCRFLNSNTQV